MRRAVGHDLLLLPAVVVLPRDGQGRILMVKHSYTDLWGLVGGAVEVGESPAEAAVRETREEVALEVTLGVVIAAVGGPDYEIEYPNGDRCAFVVTVFEGDVGGGQPTADGVEVVDTVWVSPDELSSLELNRLARALLTEVGYLDTPEG